jgi:hypothetical protein
MAKSGAFRGSVVRRCSSAAVALVAVGVFVAGAMGVARAATNTMQDKQMSAGTHTISPLTLSGQVTGLGWTGKQLYAATFGEGIVSATLQIPDLYTMPYNGGAGDYAPIYRWPHFPREIQNFTSDDHSYYFNLKWKAKPSSASATGTFCSLPIPDFPPAKCKNRPIHLVAENPKMCNLYVSESSPKKEKYLVFNVVKVKPANDGWRFLPAC